MANLILGSPARPVKDQDLRMVSQPIFPVNSHPSIKASFQY
jgi:hypothetical protein